MRAYDISTHRIACSSILGGGSNKAERFERGGATKAFSRTSAGMEIRPPGLGTGEDADIMMEY
jgi:hypothetical protein